MNSTGRIGAARDILLAWLVFIGVDFFFHASLLAPYWSGEISGLLSQDVLFRRIPYGYASFLVLTGMVYYLLHISLGETISMRSALRFGGIFGGTFALSNFLGLYSYVEVPFEHLLVFNLVYFVELIIVSAYIYRVKSSTGRTIIWHTLGLFFLLLLAGVVIQNIR